jgi:hypothetical protein
MNKSEYDTIMRKRALKLVLAGKMPSLREVATVVMVVRAKYRAKILSARREAKQS